MELSLFHHQHHPMMFLNCPISLTRTHTTLNKKNSYRLSCHCSCSSTKNTTAEPVTVSSLSIEGRRALLSCLLTTFCGVYACDVAGAVSTSRRALRGAKIPESDYTTLPNGLKYYDLKVGNGAEAKKGSRVAIHYVAKWKGITFMTSRQGMGVGGGTPYGFDVGQSERGTVLKGLDLGVEGMRVGGQRLLIVPPELAYGSKGVQEIPPNSTIELDIELLSIKQSPFGTPVKIVEG
ncbi:peptidyl-prolyl cis-trans isomerase FKBP16-4, chloroplastic-like [Vigna umbellata]|uniref:peptidyl-prolyl cis-trans isomerase FKBP16-4, chloroplastic-like n=1 Tax=Vigna umbellata TaxID=87088 RepID=UPI001F5ED338|nr:peptidyl-prolyl cis-trans isomerase FKBP16-4, chloroplastic-like [Vigna umbellata]